MRKYYTLAAAAAMTLALAACGGGGGGAPAPAEDLAQPQGFWNGPISGNSLGASYARAVVLADGRGWVFLHDGSAGGLLGLVAGQVDTTPTGYTASGVRYDVQGARAGTLALAGSEVKNNSLQLTATPAAGAPATLDLAYDSRYASAATQAAVVGTWTFTQAGGSIAGTWTIAADGGLTGSRTTGCTSTGSVKPLPGVAVYEVRVDESCTDGTSSQLAGIGKLNTLGTVLTLGVTSADGAVGMAFAVAKEE